MANKLPTPREELYVNSRKNSVEVGSDFSLLFSRSMRSEKLWKFLYATITFFLWTISVLSIVLSLVVKGEIGWYETHISDLVPAIHWMQNVAWIILSAVAISVPILNWLRNKISTPKMWRNVQAVLDIYQSIAYEDRAEEGAPHHNRVTLFMVVGWKLTWPWKKPFCSRLVAVERSGHLRRQSNVSFLVPDTADDAQGIAGMTYVMKRAISKSGLPDISGAGIKQTKNIEEYARQSFVSPEWVKKEKPEGRSYLGIPVQVHGELWGVLVFDSRNPREISLGKFEDVSLRLLILLGKLLSEG